jgi:hypothetical protein
VANTEMLELHTVIASVADALASIDASRVPFRAFQPGVGPYGEPQLVREVSRLLNLQPSFQGITLTKRTPDLLVSGHWGLEFKIVRPYGDNGQQAENWSVNMLHPYSGNASALGDCLKLLSLDIPERKAVVVVGYEHDPPQISLKPLIESFELIASQVLRIQLGQRVAEIRKPLVHTVHQRVTVFAWEVVRRIDPY